MKRKFIAPRLGWKEKVEDGGITWTDTEDGAYWTEALPKPAYYELTLNEAESLECAGNELTQKVFETIEWLVNEAPVEVRTYWFNVMDIPEHLHQYLCDTWENDHWALQGRFDFFMENGVPKMMEWNADTASIIIETAYTQWQWYEDNQHLFPKYSFQFNELYEAFVRHWKDIKEHYGFDENTVIYGTCLDDDAQEDMRTTSYVLGCAQDAGMQTKFLYIENIGWDGKSFVDKDGNHIKACYKLYPWEWLMHDEYAEFVPKTDTIWFEPIWKTIPSNKAFMALLWERYPDCPFLMPTYLGETDISKGNWVVKPMRSRTGCNVTVYKDGIAVEKTDGAYDGPVITQKMIDMQHVGGCYPMLGVWVVGEDTVALGIRESDTLITGNNSRFIPHIVVPGNEETIFNA